MICIGCGKDIPGPGDENQSGDWCPFGDCEITDFEGVNRLRQAFADAVKKEEEEAEPTEKPKRQSMYGWSSDPQTDSELQKKYGDSVHRPRTESQKCAADAHDWKSIPITFEGWDAECRKCGDRKQT